MTPIIPDTLQNTISLEVAEKYTSSWRNGSPSSKLNHIGFIKAFNISKSDIDQLALLIPDNGGCRAYLGIDHETKPSSIKLVLVPVSAQNKDILHIEGEHADDGDEGQSTIFDFTTPCPSQCAENSPLAGS
jgi:aspartate carbamoyltransferase regulatory subunit